MSDNIYTAKPIETQDLCERGCGQVATYQTRRGVKQCHKSHNKCPSVMAKKKSKQTPEKIQAMLEKLQATKLERYGDKHYVNTEKRDKTMFDKYGVTNAGQIDGHGDKVKKTKLERYGDENYVNIKQQKQTMHERYGVDNIFEDVDYIRKCTKEKLGVENRL